MSSPAMDVTARHYRGTDPLTGEPIEFWVSGETISHTPVAEAETAVDDGWILPGLVDAHNHVGIAPGGLGVDIEQARGYAYADARAGTLLIREVGSPLDTPSARRRPPPVRGSSARVNTSPARNAICVTTASTSTIPTSWRPRWHDRRRPATAG